MKDIIKNFKQYIKLPEMKIFWLFLFLVFLIFLIDLLYLEPLWVLISLMIFISIGILIFAVNVRAAKSNAKSKTEKRQFDNIISSMTDWIIIYDQDFKILLFNEAAESIFNVKSKEIIEKKLTPESIRDSKLEILAKIIFQSLAPTVIRQSPEGVYPQIVDISFDEPRLELRVITDRILDEQKQVTGFLKIVHDRTREMELLKSKNEFIAVAAHQLRTPLSAVNWALESLRKESLNESQKELADTGFAASNNLLKIVEDLLQIAKIEEGKFGYQFQKIDIVKFLQSAIEQAALVAREYKVRVYMEPPAESSIMLEVDPEKLGLALSNLLENAIKYNVENGRVVISIERRIDSPFIQINIADTGIGVSKEDLEKLFTKFFRGENAKTKETEGSGFGLYIVKNIIKRHGGQIWAESELGRGSIFHFTLATDPRLIPQREVKE